MRLRDEQKEQLVRTKALELLVEEGFNGFSMHKLAKAANVSPLLCISISKIRKI
jgi:AcrR family transcriptional regulator